VKRLLLVRHGESEWNAVRRLQGQADIGLSPKGEAQALALAPIIAQLAPDRVITSDLRRARRTADLLGYPNATSEAGLREVDVGEWTGMEIAHIMSDQAEANAARFVTQADHTGWAGEPNHTGYQAQ
jgi:broad specificity phosphatase PhoE